MALTCECPHEDCGATFEHYGTEKETTCCPECGRQQMPHLKVPSPDIIEGILNTLEGKSQSARETLFQAIRERFCVYCGALRATYKCYCHARGEDV